MKNKCDKGWNTGECCCNCANKIELYKHPWNKVNKGPSTENSKIFACIANHDCNKNQKGTICEWEHSFCELYKER